MPQPREFGDVDAMFNAIDAHIRLTERIEPTMKVVGETLAARAKNKIGHPNPPVGPFAAWEPLAESTIQDRHQQGYMDDSRMLERTGELRDAIESTAGELWAQAGVPAKSSTLKGGEDLGVIARALEFGTLTIPPRSFLGAALFENSRRVVDIVARGIFRILTR